MEWINYVLVGLLGASIGSFLNVLIYRLPRKNFFSSTRSFCPECQTQIKWYQNIPILSYLFLGGKCAQCKTKISIRYPTVELINTLIYLYCYWQYDFSSMFYILAFLGSVLLTIFFIDLDHQIIPDVITLPGIIIGLAVSLLPSGIGIVQSLIGMAVGGGALFIVALLGDLIFKKESMGGGDIKMAAMLGAFLGWKKVLFIFMSSAVIGLIISIAIMFFSSDLRKKRMVPFGPFLALAAVIAILYGDDIINFYISNFLAGR